MIERQFVNQKVKEFRIKQFIASELSKTGYSHIEIQRTPLGEKIVIYTTRPGIVVGKKGENINRLTAILKNRFKMENPQIEIGELKNPNLDASLVADKIASTFERFGSKRFKSIGYKNLQEIIDSGALGAEIVISGRGVPSTRAKSWRFKAGYLKKSGEISMTKVKKAFTYANLRTGTVGIKVSIMTPDIILPDRITLKHGIAVEETKEKPKKEIKKPKEKKNVNNKKKWNSTNETRANRRKNKRVKKRNDKN